MRDSTTVSGCFGGWPLRHRDINLLSRELKILEEEYQNTIDRVVAIWTRDRSYMNDMRPFIENIYLTEQYTKQISECSKILTTFKNTSSLNDPNIIDVIKSVCTKIADHYKEQQGRYLTFIRGINEKLNQLKGCD